MDRVLTSQRGKNDWAVADVHDIEAVLATAPKARHRRIDVVPLGHDRAASEEDLEAAVFREDMTLASWLLRWTEDRLYQPWLVQDPSTGKWRGATDADWGESETARSSRDIVP